MPNLNVHYIRCLQGLETFLARELNREFDAECTLQIEEQHRTLKVITPSAQPLREGLWCELADDWFYEVVSLEGIDHTRESLTRIAQQIDSVALKRALTLRSKDFGSADHSLASITASFTGKRNYNRWELAECCHGALQQALPHCSILDPSEGALPPHELHLRLHLENKGGWLGLRRNTTPLSQRQWKKHHRKGSLAPQLATSMIQMAKVSSGDTVLDPFCGVGTIPIEAARVFGARSYGIDIEGEACVLARDNVPEGLLTEVTFMQGSAASLPQSGNAVDAVVTDIPWGGQTQFKTESEDNSASSLTGWIEEIHRVLKPQGRVVLLCAETLVEEIRGAFDSHAMKINNQINLGLFGKRACILQISGESKEA